MRWRIVAVAVLLTAGLGAQTAHASVIGLPANNIGLVGYWSFNEGTSTIAHDYSGNGNNGTLSTTGSTLPQWVPGKFGTALNFDGSSNFAYVNSNLPTVLQLTNTGTVSAWVNPASTYDYHSTVMVGAGDVYGEQAGYGLNFHSGTLQGEISHGYSGGGDNNIGVAGTLVPLGVWTLLTLTWDGSNVYLYINGVEQASTTQTIDVSTVPSYSTFGIGAETLNGSPAGLYFPGSIDDVRVYDRALSATEVEGLYQSGLAKINVSQSPGTLAQGLAGWWTMDGADTVWSSPTAGVEYDRSGNGNTGTLENMTQSGSPTVGKIGQALSFDGSSSYIDMTSSSGVADNLSNFTVSAWFKTSANIPTESPSQNFSKGYKAFAT